MPDRRSIVSYITNTGDLQIRFSSGEGNPIGFLLVEAEDKYIFRHDSRIAQYGDYINLEKGYMYGYNHMKTTLAQRSIGNRIVAYGFVFALESNYEVQGIKLPCTKYVTSGANTTYNAQRLVIQNFRDLRAKYNNKRYRTLAVLQIGSANCMKAVVITPSTYNKYTISIIILAIIISAAMCLNHRYRFSKMNRKHCQCKHERLV